MENPADPRVIVEQLISEVRPDVYLWDVTADAGPLPAWKQAQQRRPHKKKQEPAAVLAPAGAADASAMPTKAEFAAMRREVEDFGKKGAEWAHRACAAFCLSPSSTLASLSVAHHHHFYLSPFSLPSLPRRRQPGQAGPLRRGDPPPDVPGLPGP